MRSENQTDRPWHPLSKSCIMTTVYVRLIIVTTGPRIQPPISRWLITVVHPVGLFSSDATFHLGPLVLLYSPAVTCYIHRLYSAFIMKYTLCHILTGNIVLVLRTVVPICQTMDRRKFWVFFFYSERIKKRRL